MENLVSTTHKRTLLRFWLRFSHPPRSRFYLRTMTRDDKDEIENCAVKNCLSVFKLYTRNDSCGSAVKNKKRKEKKLKTRTSVIQSKMILRSRRTLSKMGVRVGEVYLTIFFFARISFLLASVHLSLKNGFSSRSTNAIEPFT